MVPKICLIIISSVMVLSTSQEEPDVSKKTSSGSNEKRAEVVPNYGILSDDEETLLDADGKIWIQDTFKRNSEQNKYKSCISFVKQLLNLICDTDNWMETSSYKIPDKMKIVTRCCYSPCTLSELKVHCGRKIESDSKHPLMAYAMLLRPDARQRLPSLPKDNTEIEKYKFSFTPNGFFGAFHP